MNSNHSKLALFKRFSIFMLIVCFISFFTSCKTKTDAQNETGKESLPADKNMVNVQVIQKQDFTRDIISNGKLTAIEKAQLYFKNQGIIEAVTVKNGENVSKNDEIARLQNTDYRFNLDKAKIAMEKAEIDRLDALLSMGYKSLNENISPEHMKIANIRSGYNQAKVQIEEATHQLENVILKAPFAGKIEGIKQKSYEKADLSVPFCTLINDDRFTIVFSLLETEITLIKKGQPVVVTPVAGAKESTGSVTEINPRIDENGLLQVKAEVKNPGGYLEGMNVKVSIKKTVPGQLVVPKQAVVLRDNREVLFRYTNGTAYWTYVKVTDENEKQYSVIPEEGARLEPGDTIIVSNNLNLAHESLVSIK